MEINIPSLLRIKPQAINKLGKYLRQEGFRGAAVFWAEGIKSVLESTVGISLASAQVNIEYEHIVTNNEIDDAFDCAKQLPYSVDVVVAIGGGTAIDFCKYIAFIKQLPFFSVPTLISNDAFASPGSSLYINGKRKSVKTAVPHAVIVDTELVSKAPIKYIYSGMGDLISKTTAIFDWKLSYTKTGEHVNDFAATVAANSVDTFTFYVPKNLNDLNYVGIIASSLLMSGISMIIAGNSRPASGSEHLISHAYDRVAKVPGLHGIQVALASYAVSFLQQVTHKRVESDLIESGLYNYLKENPLDKEDFLKAIVIAPDMKDNFYTVLNEGGNIRKLEEFVLTDEKMGQMLK